MNNSALDEFQQRVTREGAGPALEFLIDQLRREERFHELFEALKMQLRHRMQLPIQGNESSDALDPAIRDQYENGLIEVCRDVGMELFRAGRFREGWMYLRPVGDRQAVIAVLDQCTPTDDRIDEIIEVCLHEGVDPPRGFRLMLDKYGTCNTITTFESHQAALDLSTRQCVASILVRHLYDELVANIQGHIERQEGLVPAQSSLGELLQGRPWLTAEGNYHIDVSHLGAVVRFAEILDAPNELRRALELSQYGETLDESLRYPGEEPFRDNYGAHRLYYEALLDISREPALEFFQERALFVDPHYDSTLAVEVYVDLCVRCGRGDEAFRFALEHLPPGTHTRGIAPPLVELARATKQTAALAQLYRDRDDLFGFAMTLLLGQSDETS
ncbi:MAG: hypothetical protein KDA60_18250 [Planctomycetales bacterium]|nr:hypothetical protein [Planctomycetales bacterium]